MKALVLVQPGAGKGDAVRAVRDALDLHFTASSIEFEIHEQHEKGSPGDILRARVREGFDVVVVAGGDGTVSSAFDGLQGTGIALGIIPTGTGNLIAREFGIPTEIDEAVALIAGAPRTRRIDAMRIAGRVYVLNVGVGISAAIIEGTTSENKRRFGRIAYLATALRTFRSRPRPIDLTVDGIEYRFRAVEVAVSNCAILADAMYPKGPDIVPDDGHVDVWVLGMKTYFEYFRYLLGIVFGWRTKAQFFVAAKSIVIESRLVNRPAGFESSDTPFIQIAIGDNGAGIPEAARESVFLPFFSTKDKGKGTGLGLPICKRGVEGLHGRLAIEHSSPAGTTFTVTIPLLREPPIENESQDE